MNLEKEFKKWLEEYCIYPYECETKIIENIRKEYLDGEKDSLEYFFNYLIDNGLDVDEMSLKEYEFIYDNYLDDEEKLTFFINNTDNIHYLTDEFMERYDDYERFESYEVVYEEMTGVGYYIES